MLLLAAVVAILLWGIAVPGHSPLRSTATRPYCPPPPPSRDVPAQGFTSAPDSSGLPVLTPTIPPDYRALAEDELAADLATPSNIRTEVEYDIESGCYIVHTKVGEFDIATPFMLTPAQYNQLQLRQSMQQYFNKRNSELLKGRLKRSRSMCST